MGTSMHLNMWLMQTNIPLQDGTMFEPHFVHASESHLYLFQYNSWQGGWK